MKFAFISDIHANLEALEAVFADIKKTGADGVCCLGDIVGYGANPNECVERVSQVCGKNVLLGNHDAVATDLVSMHSFNVHAKIAIEWTAETLTPQNRAYLAALPTVRSLQDATLVHATPYDPTMWYYVTTLEEAAFNFQFFNTQICVVGHTHIPMIITLDEGNVSVHQNAEISFGEKKETRILINVGSVGQPRDRNKDSSYGVLDTEEKTFIIKRVSYDVEKAQAKMKKCRMPDFLINRIAEGR